MVLEPVALGTSSTVACHKSALSAIALPHDAPHRSSDIAFTRRRVGIFGILPWMIRVAETLGFEALELFANRRVDDRSEVTAGDERLEALQLVAKLGARRELNFETRRR